MIGVRGCSTEVRDTAAHGGGQTRKPCVRAAAVWRYEGAEGTRTELGRCAAEHDLNPRRSNAEARQRNGDAR